MARLNDEAAALVKPWDLRAAQVNRSPRETFKLRLLPEGDAHMRKIIILAAAALSLAVAACNTVEGAGKDVSSAGKAVTDTARDAK